MKPCHQCPPSRCPQHTRMLCHPAGAQPHGAACAPCSRYPEGTPGPWGDPPVYPASPRSTVPSWLRWLGCLCCPSPPCTHAHAWCPRRCSRLPGCVGVCVGVTAQSPPSPAAPHGAPWAGRWEGCSSAWGPAGVWGHWDRSAVGSPSQCSCCGSPGGLSLWRGPVPVALIQVRNIGFNDLQNEEAAS